MPGHVSQHAPRPPKRGFSLIEVVAASALVALALVPALELVRHGIDLSEESVRRQLLANYAVSQVEQHLAQTAASWSTGVDAGTLAADGHPSLRYQTSCSDNPADGGITGELMDIRSTTYFDDDNDGALGAGELSCSFHTKLARFASYEGLSP